MLRKGKREASPPTPLRMEQPLPASPKGREEASPPTPLRMERGVNTTISKQRGRFFTSKKRPLQIEKGVPLFLFWMFLLARCYLVTLKLYDT